jgi:hypothetical protein
MNFYLLRKWRSSLEVIRVASEEQLAIVAFADFFLKFDTIHPDAQFLFRKTIDLKIEIQVHNKSASVVNSILCRNTPLDPFTAIHAMPDLEILHLLLCGSMKRRVDHFTPSLPKLRYFILHVRELAEFGPTAFDHLVNLEEFSIKVHDKGEMKKFETGLVSYSLKCDGVKFLKLTSAAVANIGQISTSGMVESTHPLSGLTCLEFHSDKTSDFSVFFRQFTNLRILSLGLNDLNQVDRGQLSCLSKLTSLRLICDGQTISKGMKSFNHR